jgi:hypothetical protein
LEVWSVVICQHNRLLIHQSCGSHRNLDHVTFLTVQPTEEGSILKRFLQGFLKGFSLIHTSVIDGGELPKHRDFEKLSGSKCIGAQTGKLANAMFHAPVFHTKSQSNDTSGAKVYQRADHHKEQTSSTLFQQSGQRKLELASYPLKPSQLPSELRVQQCPEHRR